MTASLVTPILLGMDGFFVCLALALLDGRVSHAIPLVALFGLCDGLALLIGNHLPVPAVLTAPAILPAIVGIWSLLVLLLVAYRTRGLVSLLPMVLALDNFIAGAAGGGTGRLEDMALSCVASSILAGVGLLAGGTLARRVVPEYARLTGAVVLFASGFVALTG